MARPIRSVFGFHCPEMDAGTKTHVPDSSGKRIRVGLQASCRPLETLLDQVGVDYAVVDALHGIASPGFDPDAFSCLILHRPPSAADGRGLRALAEQGRLAVLDLEGSWSGLSAKTRSVWIEPDPQEPILGHAADLPRRPIRAASHPSAPWLQGTLRPDPTLPALWCGWPLHYALRDFASAHASYPSTSRDPARPTKLPDPSERITTEPRALRRHLLEWMLTWLHSMIGLPLVRKAPYPDGARSVLLFRVDSDGADQAACRSLLDSLDHCGIRSTWFLHIQAHETWLEWLNRRLGPTPDHFPASGHLPTPAPLPASDPLPTPSHLPPPPLGSRPSLSTPGHEAALHAYRHAPFRDPASLHMDLARGARLWNRVAPGRPLLGYAAPFGRFTPAHASVLTGGVPGLPAFRYTSEFAFDADNLPSHPATAGLPLQIPIHPICPGSFGRTAATSSDVDDYFEARIRLMLHRGDPVALYHHPLQPGWKTLERSIATLKRLDGGIPNLTFAEWADWWDARSARRIRAVVHADGSLEISGGDGHSTRPVSHIGAIRCRLDWFSGAPMGTPMAGGHLGLQRLGHRLHGVIASQGVYSKQKWLGLGELTHPESLVGQMDPRFRTNRSREQARFHRKAALLDLLGRLLQ